ncbi:hypothetical protein HHI36_001884, partial [Cryptolaemus montrouzieri]
MKTQLVRDILGVDRQLRYESVLTQKTDLVQKIQQFFLRDDETRATAGKKETLTHRKNKMQIRFILDYMRNLYSFLKENSDESMEGHYASYMNKVIMQKDMDAVLETLVCSTDSESCIKGICSECKKRSINYDKINLKAILDLPQWARK